MPGYLPDRHHLNVGLTIIQGTCNDPVGQACSTNEDCFEIGACSVTTTQECWVDGDCPGGETCGGADVTNYCREPSAVPKPDADGDGVRDTTYDCLNCHNIEWDSVLGSYEIVEDFRDCTTCHQYNFQPGNPTRGTGLNVHHRTLQSTTGNCQYCHGSVVDRGAYDTDPGVCTAGFCQTPYQTTACTTDADCPPGDGTWDTIDAPWVPTYNPSLVTPWPSEKAFGSCWVPDTGTCSVAGTTCTTAADCPTGETCDGATGSGNFCAGDFTTEIAAGRSNYCDPDEVCVQDEATYGGGGVEQSAYGAHQGNCNYCHNGSNDPEVAECEGYVPPTSPDDPAIPGACSAGSANSGAACLQDADCYGVPDDVAKEPFVLDNHDTHHFTGATSLGCGLCHPGRPTHTPQDMRVCETCHGIPSLHNIQPDSDAAGNPGEIVVGAENPYYGHIGSNTDCNGCHGFDAPTLQAAALSAAPESGPVIPFLSTADDLALKAGSDSKVTLTGVALTNTLPAPYPGLPPVNYVSDVELTAADGSTTTITPDSASESGMEVTIPGTLDAGTYTLRAAKYAKRSNPMVLALTPAVAISSVTCADGTATIAGSGFSSYLGAVNSPTKVTGDVTSGGAQTKTETAAINSWTDTQIVAQFSACPDDGTVAVSTVWDITGDSEPPEPDWCEGDFGRDGDVDGSDLAVFSADFGRTDCDQGEICEGDFDRDNDVDGSDIAVFSVNFGKTDCPIE